MTPLEINAKLTLAKRDIARAKKLNDQANKRTMRANARLLAIEKQILSDIRSNYGGSKEKQDGRQH